MGGPDEYVLVDELLAVAKIHTLAAFDFLTAPDAMTPWTELSDDELFTSPLTFMGAPYGRPGPGQQGGDPRASRSTAAPTCGSARAAAPTPCASNRR